MKEKLAKLRPSWVVAGILVLFTLASILFSGRPVFGYGVSVVERELVIPDNPQTEGLRELATVGELPYPNGGIRSGLAGTRQPLRLGYVYTEYGILGMPYWAQLDPALGMVLYVETENHINAVPINPQRLDLLERQAGVPIPREHGTRWYNHIWGWLFPILFLVWLFLWRREDGKREEEHWARDTPFD